MNRLYEDLEAVEGACLGNLNLLAEPLDLLNKTARQIQDNKNSLFRVKSSKQCTKRSLVKFTEAFLTRFSLTIPSLAAKKAKTWEMKCFSSGFRGSQCAKSLDKSTLE